MRSTLIGPSAALLGLVVGAASCAAFDEEAAASSSNDAGPEADASDAGASADATSTPRTCIGPPTEGWSTPKRLSELRGVADQIFFVDPFVSADGLTLLASHKDGSNWKVYRATREARDAAWSKLEEIPGFANPSYAPPYPSSASRGEIVVSIPWSAASMDLGSIEPPEAGAEAGSTWNVRHFGELQRPDNEMFPTITADGVAMVYKHSNASPANPFRTLFEVTRSAPVPGSTWTPPRSHDEVPLPEDFDTPALTPNGLGLFYATTNAKDVVNFVSRRSREEVFFTAAATPVPVPSLAAPGATTRVRSMTADGCEIYLTSDRDGVLDAYVATR